MGNVIVSGILPCILSAGIAVVFAVLRISSMRREAQKMEVSLRKMEVELEYREASNVTQGGGRAGAGAGCLTS